MPKSTFYICLMNKKRLHESLLVLKLNSNANKIKYEYNGNLKYNFLINIYSFIIDMKLIICIYYFYLNQISNKIYIVLNHIIFL